MYQQDTAPEASQGFNQQNTASYLDRLDAEQRRMLNRIIEFSEQEHIHKKYSKQNHLCTKYRKMIPNLKMNKSTQTCTICIQKFIPNQIIKQLPCRHILHRQCAKKWLKVNKTCPICRLDLEHHYTQIQIQKKMSGRCQQEMDL